MQQLIERMFQAEEAANAKTSHQENASRIWGTRPMQAGAEWAWTNGRGCDGRGSGEARPGRAQQAIVRSSASTE